MYYICKGTTPFHFGASLFFIYVNLDFFRRNSKYLHLLLRHISLPSIFADLQNYKILYIFKIFKFFSKFVTVFLSIFLNLIRTATVVIISNNLSRYKHCSCISHFQNFGILKMVFLEYYNFENWQENKQLLWQKFNIQICHLFFFGPKFVIFVISKMFTFDFLN